MSHSTFEDEGLIVSTQFPVIESQAYGEIEEEKYQMKVRNMFDGGILTGIAESVSTYISHSRADIATILGHRSEVRGSFLCSTPPVSYKQWSADFASAHRQMSLSPILIMFRALSILPEVRRLRLISHRQQILDRNSLTPAEASSMCGRLFFYCYWHQEARSYLVYRARRQYALSLPLEGSIGRHLAIEAAHENQQWPLTEELRMFFNSF